MCRILRKVNNFGFEVKSEGVKIVKVNLEYQTNGKFKGVCSNCESENVKFGLAHGTTNDGWGGRMDYTKLYFSCGNCKSEWSEKY